MSPWRKWTIKSLHFLNLGAPHINLRGLETSAFVTYVGISFECVRKGIQKGEEILQDRFV